MSHQIHQSLSTVKVIEAHKCCKEHEELLQLSSQLFTFELNVDPIAAAGLVVAVVAVAVVDCRTEMTMLMVLKFPVRELTAAGDLNHGQIDFVAVAVNVAVVAAVESNWQT